MDIDDLASSMEHISLRECHHPRAVQMPTLDDDLEVMSVEEEEERGAEAEPTASTAESHDTTQPTPEDEERHSATSSRATSSAHHPVRRKATDDPPLRRGGSSPRTRHALADESISIVRGLAVPLLATVLGIGDAGIAAAVLAAAAQLVALAGLAGCKLRRRPKRKTGWGSREGVVQFPKYWWLTEIEGLVVRIMMWMVLVALRVAILTVCIGVVWMRFDRDWAKAVQEGLRIARERGLQYMLRAQDALKEMWGSENVEVLERVFFDAIEICPVRDWATFAAPLCGKGFR